MLGLKIENVKTSLWVNRKAGAPKKYPLESLEVGQGFKIPDGVNIQSMRCLVSQRGAALGIKLTVSKKLNMVIRTA